jgi:hypothetical protein
VTQYQVIAACVAHIPAMGPGGVTLGMYYQGAILPDGVPEDRIKHLLDAGMITAVDKAESGHSDDAGEGRAPTQPPENEHPQQVEQAPAGDQPSVNAPTSVNSRSSKGDLVEYGVAHGGNRTELDALNRDQLIERYVRKPE